MSLNSILAASPARKDAFAALIYGGFLAVLTLASVLILSDLSDRAAAVSAQASFLDQIDSHKATSGAGAPGDEGALGSPFLDGESITIAGAALQQRVGAAVKKAGGNVLSSQIELDGPLSKDGFVRLTVNFEVSQPALQQILYDLEAGMPFLFIDTLTVQAPQALGEKDERMRVLVAVLGQWLPKK